MVPVNFLSRMVSRPQLAGKLSRNLSTNGRLFGCGCKQSREDCPPKKCETSVSKARKKCKPMDAAQYCDGEGKGSPPEFCSKTALSELSWKMQDLQKSWEIIATQMEKDCDARGYKKDKPEKPKSHCKVKPPIKEEQKGGGAVFVVLAAVILAALLGYYLYRESEKKKDGDESKDKDKEEKKEEEPKKEEPKKDEPKNK